MRPFSHIIQSLIKRAKMIYLSILEIVWYLNLKLWTLRKSKKPAELNLTCFRNLLVRALYTVSYKTLSISIKGDKSGERKCQKLNIQFLGFQIENKQFSIPDADSHGQILKSEFKHNFRIKFNPFSLGKMKGKIAVSAYIINSQSQKIEGSRNFIVTVSGEVLIYLYYDGMLL